MSRLPEIPIFLFSGATGTEQVRARYGRCVECPGFQVRTAQKPPSRRKKCEIRPKEPPAGTEAGTCIHCRTKQCAEDGDEPVYSPGNTQTPVEDEESEEVATSSSSSCSSPYPSGGARASAERPPVAAQRSCGRRQNGRAPDTPPPEPSPPPPPPSRVKGDAKLEKGKE